MGGLLGMLLCPRPLLGQGAGEQVRGRVIGTDQVAITGATVTVTASESRAARTAHTDRDGRFGVLFLEAEGSYTIFVQKIGYTPVLKKIERTGAANILNTDIVLAQSAFPLDPLVARTPPPSASASKLDRPSIGGYSDDALRSAGFLIDPSDLMSLIQLVPGVQAQGDSAYSVLGAPADQNSIVIDGIRYTGTSLPPDAVCSAKLSTTTSDPARGGFAGGQLSVASCRGHEYFQSAIRSTILDPALTWNDPAAPTLSRRVGTASGFVSGAIRSGAAHYHLSYSGTLSSTPATSLLAPRDTLLAQLGLSRDSLALLQSIATSLQIPLAGQSVPNNVTSGRLTSVLNLDWAVGPTTSLFLTATGNLATESGIGMTQLAFPSTASEAHRSQLRVSLGGSSTIGIVLDELTAVYSRSRSTTDPYVVLPSASVRLGTALNQEQSGLAYLQLGGGPASAESHANIVTIQNKLSWTAGRGLHQLSLGQEFNANSVSSVLQPPLGRFEYASLADLQANRPASYTRTVSGGSNSGRSVGGSAWWSDVWSPSKAVSFQGGLRIDLATLGPDPAYNPSVDSAFGIRTNGHIVDRFVSPRLGFAWLIRQRPDQTIKDPVTGSVRTIGYSDMTVLGQPRSNLGSGITFFANVGAYHGSLAASHAASRAANTGLAGSISTLFCVGDDTPVPNWASAQTASFTTCSSGVSNPSLTPVPPSVAVSDPDYRAPTDWKLNLALSGLDWGTRGGTGAIAIIFKHGTGYPSSVDLNLRPAPAFTLADEGGRPVFAPLTSIIPGTGFFEPNSARLVPGYGLVIKSLADLQSDAIQLNTGVVLPRLFARPGLRIRIDYSFNWQRSQQRGADGSTAADPSSVEWVGGAQPAHQFVISLATPVRLWWFRLNPRLNILSGTAYTPSIVGDVNGDGLSNDRAFVFDPEQISDSVLASQYRAVLAQAPASAQRCLLAQVGSIASANSCRGPWQTRLDLTLDLVPPRGAGFGDRLHAILNLVNAGAAVARIAGVHSQLLTNAPVDSRLFYVTGFDAGAGRFNYKVNREFGQPINSGGSHYPPFAVRLGLSYSLGGPPQDLLMRQMGLTHNNGEAYSAAELRDAFSRQFPNPADTILALKDSLALSPGQVQRVQRVAAVYDSVFRTAVQPAVEVLLRRGGTLRDADLTQQWSSVFFAISAVRTETRDQALAVLGEQQLAQLRSRMH